MLIRRIYRLSVAFFVGCVMVNMLASDASGAEELVLVEEGRPRAQIVIAEAPPRMVRLAAEELQTYVEKISGAALSVGTAPDAAYPVTIYVGRSSHTDTLGITDAGLKHGAFRIDSGPDFLVLLGHDFDYDPIEPWPRGPGGHQQAASEAMDALSGSTWRNPMSDGRSQRKDGMWPMMDEGGSLNAVHELLRLLGVRWFMPGELGEVIPARASILLPKINKVVHPDFKLRVWLMPNRVIHDDFQQVLYERRVGAGGLYEVLGASGRTHGLRDVHGRTEMQQAYPEYYALIGGTRDTYTHGTGHACFSSEGFFQETVKFTRFVFDHYNEPLIQLSPQDGFRQCECEECRDMTPSDNVFGFLDRVAREVYKTHPDRIILSAGYSSYRAPPENIESFSPNFTVSINNMGRPRFADAAYWKQYMTLVERWLDKLESGFVIRVENTRYGSDPIPAIHPRSIVRDLRAMKGTSLGERNELRDRRDFPASTHLNLYVMGRYYWDVDQDLEALLDEYYARFYGPAQALMKDAFEFAESRYKPREEPLEKGWYGRRKALVTDQIRFWETVEKARGVAGESLYGKRIDVLLSEIPRPLANMRAERIRLETEGDPRADAPLAVATDAGNNAVAQAYTLKHIHSGEEPPFETRFTVVWDADQLVFDVYCAEPDMENLNITQNVWGGDSVAILLETPYHAHYQIEVNPDGKIYDRTWASPEAESWASQAIVQTERGEDYWRLVVRIPVADVAAGQGDPFHFVVGEKPVADDPWYFNLGRVRVREMDKKAWLFSPVGRGNFHQPAKFGRLIVGSDR